MHTNNAKRLLCELRSGLQELYGNRLAGLYLYGSYARGEPDEESDIDVLVVLDRVGHYASEVERTGHLIAKLSLDYGVSISRVFVSQQDWSDRQSPFLASARLEAIPA